MEQMTDDHLPTQTEAKLMAAVWDDNKSCNTTYVTEIAQISPQAGQIFAERMNSQEVIVIQLVKRQITWGEAARRFKQGNEDMKIKLAHL